MAAVEADIIGGTFAQAPLDDQFLLLLHHRICGDLVPAWAGKWRDIEVSVGRLQPPPPHQLPMLMRDFALDLDARWPAASAQLTDLTLELLAFAEGRFLTIHPFRDFNGRTVRLMLTELRRRLDLPRVVLAPENEQERAAYFLALESADRFDWQPLMEIWRDRFQATIGPEAPPQS